ncbi:unnamed protein product [Sphagnum tenellum]
MGAKHSKREATVGSPAANGSLCSKVARSRSLPVRGFARRLDGGDGRSFRRRISHDEISLREKLEEHQRLIGGLDKDRIDEETVKDRFSVFCAGKKSHDVVQNCISPFLDDKKYRGTIHEAETNENCTTEIGSNAHEECLTQDVKLAVCVSASSNFEGSCENVVGAQDTGYVFPTEPAAVVKGESALTRSQEQQGKSDSGTGHYDAHSSAGSTEVLSDDTVETAVENGLISVSKPSSPEKISLEGIQSERTPPSEKEPHAAIESATERSKQSPLEVCSASDSGAYYQFQAQKPSSKGSRLQRQRRKLVFEQGFEVTGVVLEENMGLKGKLSLSSNSGKRQKDLQRNSLSDGSEFMWGSLPGKRMKDGLTEEEQSPGLSDIRPDAFAWGLMGRSDPFLGFDAARVFGQHLEVEDQMTVQRARTPSKSERWRVTTQKTRGLRAAPKCVSSLQAQFLDERDRDHDMAIGPLEGLLFSFGVGVGVMSVASTNRSEVERLSHLLKEAQCQMQDLKRELANGGCMSEGKKGAQKVQPVLVVDEVERPFVGKEAQRTVIIPQITSQDIQRTLAHRDASDTMPSEGYKSVKSVVTVKSSLSKGDQMAELEAELEAELDQLTGGDSEDLALTGLPAHIEEESDDDNDDDYSAPAEPVYMNNYAVSPRELTRLLHKLQSTRQEELITELEEALQIAQTQLESKEKELELWKDCDDTMVAQTPIAAKVPIDGPVTCSERDVEVTSIVKSSLPSEDQASFHSSLQNLFDGPRGNLSNMDSSRFSSSKLSGKREKNMPGGEMENKPHTAAANQIHGESVRGVLHSEKKWTNDDVCDEFLQVMVDGCDEVPPQNERAMPSALDCKLIIEDCEIEKLLVDSVQDLQQPVIAESSGVDSNTSSLYDYSSGISLEDGWDNLLNMDVSVASCQVKLSTPHPTRRSSFNWEITKPKQSKAEDKEGSQWDCKKQDQSTTIMEHARIESSSKMASEIPDGGFLDDKSSDSLCLVKYIDSSARPAQDFVNSAEYRSIEGVHHVQSSFPSDGVKGVQLFETPKEVYPEQQSLYVTERNTVAELSPMVLDKIAHWEGLMEGETPGPATGSDWECQSCASELGQQCTLDSSYEGSDVFGEDNLVLEAEEILGRMLITQIVEKTRRGSHIVKNAQMMLATLENDETGNWGDMCMSRVLQTGGREKPGDVPQLAKLPHSYNFAKPETGLTLAEQGAVEMEEDYFFHQLTPQIKDKRVSESLKDRPGKEPGYMVRLNMEQIPLLDLGENSQFLPEGESSGSRDVLHDVACGAQSVETSRDINVRGTIDVNSNENWLLCRDVHDVHKELYGGSGCREDEV